MTRRVTSRVLLMYAHVRKEAKSELEPFAAFRTMVLYGLEAIIIQISL